MFDAFGEISLGFGSFGPRRSNEKFRLLPREPRDFFLDDPSACPAPNKKPPSKLGGLWFPMGSLPCSRLDCRRAVRRSIQVGEGGSGVFAGQQDDALVVAKDLAVAGDFHANVVEVCLARLQIRGLEDAAAGTFFHLLAIDKQAGSLGEVKGHFGPDLLEFPFLVFRLAGRSAFAGIGGFGFVEHFLQIFGGGATRHAGAAVATMAASCDHHAAALAAMTSMRVAGAT